MLKYSISCCSAIANIIVYQVGIKWVKCVAILKIKDYIGLF